MLTTVLLAASMVTGQAEQVSPVHKELEAYAPFIGTWEGEITAQRDIPQLVKKGDKVPILGSFRWAKNRNGVVLDAAMILKGQTVDFTKGFTVWDPQKKKIVGLDSYADGGIYRYEVDVNNGVLTYSGHGSRADRTPTSSTIIFRSVNKNLWEVQFTNQMEGTEKLPDGEVIKMKRIDDDLNDDDDD